MKLKTKSQIDNVQLELKPNSELKSRSLELLPAELRPPNIKLGYALPMIVSTSCPNCTKPDVARRN